MDPRIDLSSAELAAKSLLGCVLVVNHSGQRMSGKIVETEAYTQNDPASHAYKGKTVRNASMFGPAGTLYVYFTYGMHYCVNIVTGRVGTGEAVLIRALEPIEGTEIMRARRRIEDVRKLTNGPAKLTQALGITKEHNGVMLGAGGISVEYRECSDSIIQTSRVGISRATELPLRFYIANNPFVSFA